MKMREGMYVVCVSHPQPHLDVSGVKSYPFSSVIGREKTDAEVNLLCVVSPNQLRQ